MPRSVPSAALYARVSTSEQDVQMQVDELRVEAQRRGWKIVGTYTDEGVSGSRERRPQLDRLLAEVRAGKLDVADRSDKRRYVNSAEVGDDDDDSAVVEPVGCGCGYVPGSASGNQVLVFAAWLLLLLALPRLWQRQR